jgi:hypothetical protein
MGSSYKRVGAYTKNQQELGARKEASTGSYSIGDAIFQLNRVLFLKIFMIIRMELFSYKRQSQS